MSTRGKVYYIESIAATQLWLRSGVNSKGLDCGNQKSVKLALDIETSEGQANRIKFFLLLNKRIENILWIGIKDQLYDT